MEKRNVLQSCEWSKKEKKKRNDQKKYSKKTSKSKKKETYNEWYEFISSR